ncbi:MAG: helix-turn-helix domain-containing protein [Thermofilaceae archaeon]
MKAYIIRRVTPEELLSRVAELEVHGRHEDLKRLLSEHLMYYEEEGELGYMEEEEVPIKVARRILSERMCELLALLKQGRELSVSEIARVLGRSPSNVYTDLKFLQRYGAVRFEKHGRHTIPRLLLEELLFVL